MKIDWKNVLGAAFFVAAIFGSGIASAFEQPMDAANRNVVCSCARVAFNDPSCTAIRERGLNGGGISLPGTSGHGATPTLAAPTERKAGPSAAAAPASPVGV